MPRKNQTCAAGIKKNVENSKCRSGNRWRRNCNDYRNKYQYNWLFQKDILNNLQGQFHSDWQFLFKARKIFDISPGDQLVILGDEEQGIAIIKPGDFYFCGCIVE